MPRYRGPQVVNGMQVVIQDEDLEPPDIDDARAEESIRRQPAVRQIVHVEIHHELRDHYG